MSSLLDKLETLAHEKTLPCIAINAGDWTCFSYFAEEVGHHISRAQRTACMIIIFDLHNTTESVRLGIEETILRRIWAADKLNKHTRVYTYHSLYEQIVVYPSEELLT